MAAMTEAPRRAASTQRRVVVAAITAPVAQREKLTSGTSDAGSCGGRGGREVSWRGKTAKSEGRGGGYWLEAVCAGVDAWTETKAPGS